MTRSLTVFFILALICPLFAEVELNGNPKELADYLSDIPEVVAIGGTAEKKLPADKAIIHIEVSSESKSMDEAIESNRALRTTITTKLIGAGLPMDAIKAAQFSSTPESGFFSDKIKSYKVENTMKITVTNEAQFRVVASLIDSSDDINYKSTEFELADRKAKERELLAEACRDAAAKKAIYETELGVTLTPVWLTEGRVMIGRPQMRLARAKQASFVASDTDASFAPPPQFDEIQLNASITIHYKLQAK